MANLELQPTLWRTCRVLANPVRLRMLRELFHKPDQTVTSIAARVDVPLPIASRYLRELNARGLLRATRIGSSVSYRPAPNPSVRQATSLVAVLRAALAMPGDAVLAEVFRLATAFTHPRRVAIVAALGHGPLARAELKRRLRISEAALDRHLDKLRRRGFIGPCEEGHELARPGSPLAATLLKLALEES